MSEIKNCPFCGEEPVVEQGNSGFFFSQCPKCLSCSDLYATKDEAASSWNARALPPEVERLERSAIKVMGDLALRDDPEFNELGAALDALAALKGK